MTLSKKIGAVLTSICLCLAFAPSLALADSGYSSPIPLVKKETEPIFLYLAPRTQTTFGKYCYKNYVVQHKIGKVEANCKSVIILSRVLDLALGVGGKVADPVDKVVLKVAKIANKRLRKQLKKELKNVKKFKKKFKKDAVLKVKVEFRWVDAKRYIGQYRTTSWYEYKGYQLSKKMTETYHPRCLDRR